MRGGADREGATLLFPPPARPRFPGPHLLSPVRSFWDPVPPTLGNVKRAVVAFRLESTQP